MTFTSEISSAALLIYTMANQRRLALPQAYKVLCEPVNLALLIVVNERAVLSCLVQTAISISHAFAKSRVNC